MESEKVKEIKEILEQRINFAENLDNVGGYCVAVGVIALKECLILINEFENENQQLKARIAELEDGIAKSMLGCEFLPECTNDKLKQFAEMLKEEARQFMSSMSIEYAIPYCKIDKTLKECLKE